MQVQHLQIGIHHAGDHRELHRIATELTGQQRGSRRIPAVANLPPKVQLVTGIQRRVVIVRAAAFAEHATASTTCTQAQRRKQGSTCLGQLRISLLDPCGRSQQIGIGSQRLAHKQVQFLAVELLPPLRMVDHRLTGLLLVEPLFRHGLLRCVKAGCHGTAGQHRHTHHTYHFLNHY